MDNYTVCVTTAKGFGYFTSNVTPPTLTAAIVDAMGTTMNGSCRVTLIAGTKYTGDVVARWYPKTRREEYRRLEAETVVGRVVNAISELHGTDKAMDFSDDRHG